jgi:hypothetical protein
MKHTKKNSTVKKKIFTKKNYNASDGFLTGVWGPMIWGFLHIISFNYPVNPTNLDKKNYMKFILSLKNILPCKYCRINLTKNFKSLPLTIEDMKNRETFSRYIYNLHELINKMLGKVSGLTYCDVRDKYEHFRSRCTNKNDLKEKIKKELGCLDPLYGKKSKCIIKIVSEK